MFCHPSEWETASSRIVILEFNYFLFVSLSQLPLGTVHGGSIWSLASQCTLTMREAVPAYEGYSGVTFPFPLLFVLFCQWFCHSIYCIVCCEWYASDVMQSNCFSYKRN